MASSLRDEISRLELLHAAHPDGLVFPHLADAYRRAGRFDQAESLLSAGLRRHAEYSSAHVVLGRLRLDQGQGSEAENAFRRVLQLDPQNQVALEHLADIAAGQGRFSEAAELLRRLTRFKSDESLAARVLELEGAASRPSAAVANGNGGMGAAKASNGGGRTSAPIPPEMAGDTPEPGEVVTETMAELYSRQGLHHRAVSVYRHLLERFPGDARLQQKLEKERQALAAKPAPQEPPRPTPSHSPATSQGPGDSTAETPAVRVASVPASGGRPAPEAPAQVEPAQVEPAQVEPAQVEQKPVEPGRAEARSEGATPGPRRSEPSERGGPTIRDALGAILAWTPLPASPQVSQPPSRPEPRVTFGPAEVRLAGAAHATPVSVVENPEPASDRGEPTGEPASSTSAGEDASPSAASEPEPASPTSGAQMSSRLVETEDPLASATPQTRSLIALTDMLVGLLEYRDPFFRGSSSLTRLLATSVAEELGLTVEERVDLALAAVLRDLGRLALGGKLLPNPRLTHTVETRRKIERHVDLALHLMEGIELPRPVRLAVRHHHERWDGAGYPDALAADDIPVLARILAVVDSFAAMVSPRPYRLPRKVPEAAAELQQEAGTRYDPEVVNALVRVLARREQPHLGFVQRHHVLMVNPDHPGAVVTAAKLCSAGYLAEVAVDPATARERLRRVPVAALVISAESGAEETAALLRELRVDPMFANLPIVVSDAAGVGLRVRLLESGADVCFPPGVRHAELQGTLGALVRRGLRARGGAEGAGAAEAPWLALQGDVKDFPLTWLLQVMKYDSRTAAVGIRGAQGEGVIYLRTGDAVHAQIRGGDSGESALREMLQWKSGRFTVQPDARPRERTITTSIMHLLLTQAVSEDHAAAGIFGAVTEG